MRQSKTFITAEAFGQCAGFLIGHWPPNTIQKFSGMPDSHLQNIIRLEILRWKNS
ncbi:hypothetical protein B0I29_116158 [Actinoplanes lutulentus]|uniref:Uncharacterized protein n=2 Tax=Actinoplanes lutulentus TaxID=1287878 RepID=A0A327Z4J4_9ACTN|nr:hypothetical protein B0I29_116158 [Actinoplanes lutulentus]